MEKAEKKSSLSILANHWSVLEDDLNRNIKVLENLIFTVSSDNNEKIFTARDLNIAKREILVRLKELPRKLLENLDDSYLEQDILNLDMNI